MSGRVEFVAIRVGRGSRIHLSTVTISDVYGRGRPTVPYCGAAANLVGSAISETAGPVTCAKCSAKAVELGAEVGR